VPQEIFPVGWAVEMKGSVVSGLLPLWTFGAAPSNSRIPGCLCVLAQSTQAAEYGQIVSVNRDAVVEVFVCGAHET
jgi:hypothetical protein